MNQPLARQPQDAILKPVRPPIPDLDGDRTLTGRDILPPLLAERAHMLNAIENPGTATTAATPYPVHDILRGIDTNGFAQQLAQSVRTETVCSQRTLHKITDEMNQLLAISVDSILDPPPGYDPKQQLHKYAQGPEQDMLKHQQLRSAIAFAESFHETFPKRIAITPDEVPVILELFADTPEHIERIRGVGVCRLKGRAF